MCIVRAWAGVSLDGKLGEQSGLDLDLDCNGTKRDRYVTVTGDGEMEREGGREVNRLDNYCSCCHLASSRMQAAS